VRALEQEKAEADNVVARLEAGLREDRRAISPRKTRRSSSGTGAYKPRRTGSISPGRQPSRVSDWGHAVISIENASDDSKITV
jgi:hypothetical protein